MDGRTRFFAVASFLFSSAKAQLSHLHVKRIVEQQAETEIVSLELDGARSGDTSATWKGTGSTHGFALGSSQSTTTFVPQNVVAERYAGPTSFANSDYSFYLNELAHAASDGQGTWAHCGPYPNALFQYSCHAHDANTTPDLAACDPNGNDAAGAYLKFIADAFASNTRYNVRYSFHALLTPRAVTTTDCIRTR